MINIDKRMSKSEIIEDLKIEKLDIKNAKLEKFNPDKHEKLS